MASGEGKVAPASEGKIYLRDFQGAIRGELSSPNSIANLTFGAADKLLASTNEGGGVNLWRLGEKVVGPVAIEGSVTLYSIAISDDGRELATGSRSGEVRRYNIESKPVPLSSFKFPDNSVNSLAYSPDGAKMAIGLQYGKLVIKSLTDGKTIKLDSATEDTISALRFSGDGKFLATASRDGEIKLWDGDGNPLKTFPQNLFGIAELKFSPDSLFLAAAYTDGTVRVWDIKGNLRAEYKVSREPIYGINFTANGQGLITVDRDGTIESRPVNQGLQEIDQLLNRGCDWLKDYLSNHPQDGTKLTKCHGE